MTNVRRLVLLALPVVLLLLLAACADDTDEGETTAGSDVDDAEAGEEPASDGDAGDGADGDRDQYILDEPTSVDLGLMVPGMQQFFILSMQDAGLDEKYNLDFDIREVQSPPALHLAVAEKEVDFGFAGLTSAVLAREEGRDTVIVNALAGTNTLVLTQEDSDVDSVADIEGTRWATYSGPGGFTFQMFEALTEELYGFNLQQDSEVVEAAAPAVLGFMEQGEIEVGMLGAIDAIKAVLDGGYRPIADLAGDWEDHHGDLPATVMLATNDEYVEENPEVVVAFNAAFAETLEYIDENPHVWEDFAETAEVPMDGGPEMLEERVGGRLVQTWDEGQVEAQMDLLDVLIEYADEGTFVDEVPDGMFRTDLQPGEWNG
jgi:ABC-type nitrate/sulfonate/bicarbonate transport system substrate-binding protein